MTSEILNQKVTWPAWLVIFRKKNRFPVAIVLESSTASKQSQHTRQASINMWVAPRSFEFENCFSFSQQTATFSLQGSHSVSCRICHADFGSEAHLTRHLREVHERIFESVRHCQRQTPQDTCRSITQTILYGRELLLQGKEIVIPLASKRNVTYRQRSWNLALVLWWRSMIVFRSRFQSK